MSVNRLNYLLKFFITALYPALLAYEYTQDAHTHTSAGKMSEQCLPKVHLCVIGATAVGKSAIFLRFLTPRFIGEYEQNAEQIYNGCIEFESEYIDYVIKDTQLLTRISKGPMSVTVVF